MAKRWHLRMNLTFNKIERVEVCNVINRSNMHISYIRHILYILFILQTLHILHIFHALHILHTCHIMHVAHNVLFSILFSKGQVSTRSSFSQWVTDTWVDHDQTWVRENLGMLSSTLFIISICLTKKSANEVWRMVGDASHVDAAEAGYIHIWGSMIGYYI